MPMIINPTQNSPNIFINGDMTISQRGTSFTNAGNTLDRWFTNSTGSNTTQALSGSGISGLPNFLRLLKSVSQINTQSVGQNVETLVAKRYAGQTLTFSFWARMGSNYSSSDGVGNQLNVVFKTGTGTDESIRSGFTGSVTVLTAACALTTSFQRFAFTVTIPSNATEFAPLFIYNPSGGGGANDYFDITGVLLTTGGLQDYRNAGSSYQDELQMCMRYFEKSSEPGIYALDASGSWAGSEQTFWATGAVRQKYTYQVRKRANATLILWNPSNGASGQAADRSSANANIAWALGDNGTSGFEISTAVTTGHQASFHWTADAEIF